MSDKAAVCAAWLATLPVDQELPWATPCMNAQTAWSSGIVTAVVTHEFRVAIVKETDVALVSERSDGFPYVLARDLDVHAVYDYDRNTFVCEFPVPQGIMPSADQEEELAAALAAHPERRRRGIATAWSADAITAGLHAWTVAHTGREDIRWVWDTTNPMDPRVIALIEAHIAGIEPTYDLGDGLRVSEQAFSALHQLGAFERRRRRPRRSEPTPITDHPFTL